jgi:hypothetical protein
VKYRYVREVVRHPQLALWCAFLVMIPFYIFPSGLPQPSDVLAVLLVPAAIIGWNGRMNRALTSTIRPLLAFTLWVTAVNYGWAIVTGNFDFLKSYMIFPIYYLFNVAVFVSALIVYQRFGDIVLRLTLHVVSAVVLFQVGASFVSGVGIYRGSVFFNSPNQLGFYALLAATAITLLHRRCGTGLLRASVALTGCAYLAALSASRAALGGIAVLFFLLVFSNPRVIVVASIAAVGLLTIGGPVSNALDNVQARVSQDRHPNTSFVEERGYDRLWEHKEYLLFGAGEGDVQRFRDTPTSPGEVHSSFATVLFSYGVIGMLAFLLFIRRILKGASLRLAIMLLPMLAYTLAHNGLRFTMLWMTLALFVAVKVPSRTPLGQLA